MTGILNVATLYAVRWPEESHKAQQTLAEAAGGCGTQEAEEEAQGLIAAGRSEV